MDRPLLDRWTDTTVFGVALAISGAMVFPVLALGLVVSVGMVGFAFAQQTTEVFGAVIVVLAAGGAVGVIGWMRARHQVWSPEEYNLTATLVCLVVGAITALAVGAIVAVPLSAMMPERAYAWPGFLFVAANVVWGLHGIGWMQRLARRYAEETGRAFDGIPTVALVITIALAVAATLITTAL